MEYLAAVRGYRGLMRRVCRISVSFRRFRNGRNAHFPRTELPAESNLCEILRGAILARARKPVSGVKKGLVPPTGTHPPESDLPPTYVSEESISLSVNLLISASEFHKGVSCEQGPLAHHA